jgi:hypothetical protein
MMEPAYLAPISGSMQKSIEGGSLLAQKTVKGMLKIRRGKGTALQSKSAVQGSFK